MWISIHIYISVLLFDSRYEKYNKKNKKDNLAIVVGNGVNRYGNDNGKNSWKELLIEIAK